ADRRSAGGRFRAGTPNCPPGQDVVDEGLLVGSVPPSSGTGAAARVSPHLRADLVGLKGEKPMTSATAVRKGKRPEDERLGVGANLAYGLQHVLTMYGGIIAVPLIVGNAAGLDSTGISLLIASCLFMGGLATLLQTVGLPFFGSQLPLVQGVSFANVATILAILSGGGDITTIFGSVIVAAVIGVLIAPFFAKIIRFFPPVVTGTVIATIGLSLLPVAGGWA